MLNLEQWYTQLLSCLLLVMRIGSLFGLHDNSVETIVAVIGESYF